LLSTSNCARALLRKKLSHTPNNSITIFVL
jgi:hypothetical protein